MLIGLKSQPIFSEALIPKRIGANHLILQPKFSVFPGEWYVFSSPILLP